MEREKLNINKEQWREYFNKSDNKLVGIEEYVASINHPEFSESRILKGFAELFELVSNKQRKDERISLRTLSALCFSGDSKFLDQRRNFIENICPIATTVIEPRVIMLSAYIPEDLERAIFVENFESFRATVRAVKASKYHATTAVIYSAGYRSSATLIREEGNCQFVAINQVNVTQYRLFSDWWYSTRQGIPVFFWGDLDFDGMRILKSLRNSFSNTISFRSAYEMVLNLHQKGVSHSCLNPHKGNQKDPDETGCEYADKVLLPAIRKQNKFTDQEVVGADQIIEALMLEFSD